MFFGEEGKMNLNIAILILNILVGSVVIAFFKKWRELREQIRSRRTNKEGFIFTKDIVRGDSPEDHYLRLPFVHYRFLGAKIGFVEIGDFMMQWGTVYDETTVTFADKFKKCCGCVCIPAKGGGGQFDICVKSVSSTSFDVYAAGCERPFYYIAYGSRYKYEDEAGDKDKDKEETEETEAPPTEKHESVNNFCQNVQDRNLPVPAFCK